MIKLKSYAKINFYLDIGEKLDNGYHLIETIFQTINLFDEIDIEELAEPIYRIECNDPEVPTGKDSMTYRAIETMMKGKNKGVAVSINKNIPLSSGLGGGSSNIAAILLGICKLFSLEINPTQLMDIAICFGMDIPFFMKRGTVYARGRGEILFPLISIESPIHLVLVNPGIRISTQWAYETFDEELRSETNKLSLNINRFLHRRSAIRLSEITKTIYNSFDPIICKKYPIISQIKNQLIEMGALTATISGSGPTVYGILESKNKADEVYNRIKDKYPFVYRTNTVGASNIFSDSFRK